MALVCLVTLEMAAPDVPLETLRRWKLQREHGDSLSPEPFGNVRVWRGLPEARNWDLLEGLKKREGWRTLSHRRDFVQDGQDGERKDQVEFAA